MLVESFDFHLLYCHCMFSKPLVTCDRVIFVESSFNGSESTWSSSEEDTRISSPTSLHDRYRTSVVDSNPWSEAPPRKTRWEELFTVQENTLWWIQGYKFALVMGLAAKSPISSRFKLYTSCSRRPTWHSRPRNYTSQVSLSGPIPHIRHILTIWHCHHRLAHSFCLYRTPSKEN